MPSFDYKAVNLQGETQEGTLEAPNQAQALEQLQRQGLIPVRVKAGKGGKAEKKIKRSLFASKKLKQEDIVALTQQLSSMLKAGLPLDRSFGILLEISDNPAVIDLVKDLQEKVRGGGHFADALEESGQFSRFYVNMVRAGEASGSIDQALSRLVSYLLRAKELRSTVISALTYPAILFFVAVVSIIALLLVVVPQFSSMFEDMGAELPALTQAVLAATDILQSYWWVLLGVFLLILMGAQYMLSNEKARTKLDRSMLKWPMVGDLVGKVEMARFSRSLSTLLNNGVPLLGSLRIVKNTMGNRVMAQAIGDAADSLKQGESLTQTLLAKGVFPAYALHMLRVGEETGRMEELLDEVADIYDDEVKTSVGQMLSMLEPILILIMAMAILMIIGAVLLPMISMGDLVR